jgi:hypothetical protein
MRALEEPPGDSFFAATLRVGGVTEFLLEMRTQSAIHDRLSPWMVKLAIPSGFHRGAWFVSRPSPGLFFAF